MRRTIGFILILCTAITISCKQKNGLHRVVDISQQNIPTDEVYVTFLSDQIERYPKAEDNYLKLAEIYLDSDKITSAIVVLKQASERMPNNITILTELGSLYLQQMNADALSLTLSKIRELDPDHMEYLKLSAGYSLLLGDYNNSLFFSNRAMLANPYDDQNYFLRGSAQLIYKDSLSALQSFTEAYKLKDHPRYFAEIFSVAMAVRDFDLAYEYLADFSSAHPDTELCLEWGSYYRSINRVDTTKYILKNCLAHRPGEPRTYYELATAYVNDSNDSALYYVDQYLEMRPDAADGMLIKAKIYEKRNYYAHAQKFYLMAIETDSTFTLAKDGLANLERKVAYLRLIRRREEIQLQSESLNQLNSKEINQ